MKFFRFVLIVCILALLPCTSLEAAGPQKRGIQIIPKTTPLPESLYGKDHAVVIGISSYSKLPPLEYAGADARAMAEKLNSLGFETVVLTDRDATRDSILKALGDDLPGKVRPNDRVVIFFAGHTRTETAPGGARMGYIVPFDADQGNIAPTSISMDQLREISRRLQANHVAYFVDSCFSGLDLTASVSFNPGDRNYVKKISSRKAHQMLAAGVDGETALRNESGYGAFTAYILRALDGAADRDGKGFATFSELASYVKLQVSRFSAGKQIPQYGSIDGDGEVIFALKGRPAEQQAVASGKAPAEEKRTPEADEALSLAAKQQKMEEQKRLSGEQGKTDEGQQRPPVQAAVEASRDGRFVSYENGTVLDTRTSLMWAARDNGADINWQEARSYCQNYRGGGYTDWRMPTQEELASLYDETLTSANPPAAGCTGGYRITGLIHLTCCCPWASETRGSTAAFFGFSSGPRNWLDQCYAGGIRVLPVRSAK